MWRVFFLSYFSSFFFFFLSKWKPFRTEKNSAGFQNEMAFWFDAQMNIRSNINERFVSVFVSGVCERQKKNFPAF